VKNAAVAAAIRALPIAALVAYLIAFWLPGLSIIIDKAGSGIAAQAVGIRQDAAAAGLGALEESTTWRRMLDRNLSGLRGNLKPVLENSAADLAEVQKLFPPIAEQLALLGDCHLHPQSCLAPRITGVLDNASADLAAAHELFPPLQQQFNLLGDCHLNPHTCLAPRAAGTARALELAAGDFSTTAKLFPEFLKTAQKTDTNLAGVTADFHTFTSKFVGPTTWKAKVWEGVKTGGYIASRWLP